MNFIKEIESTIYLLVLHIKPNSRQQELVFNNHEEEYLTINLRSKPIHNKANRELLSFLKKKFRNQLISIEISRGVKSTNKVVRLVFEKTISKRKVVELLKK
ncbi:MAG: DUF167 domain-containing protein [Candidatus Lokiarchaeota archaeon]|jgi:uncharacterized protein (TIGR00251 family)